MKKLYDLTDEEAIYIANLALGSGNDLMKNPCVHHHVDDTVKLITVVDEYPIALPSIDELTYSGFDFVEIDQGLNVRVVYNTACNLYQIYDWFRANDFAPIEDYDHISNIEIDF